MNKEKYYAVLSNYRQQEYASYDKALEATDFMVIIEHVCGSEYNYGWITRKIKLDLHFRAGLTVTENYYCNLGWKFEVVKTHYLEVKNVPRKKAKHVFEFTDPLGGNKQFETDYDFNKEGEFEKLFKYIKLFQKYALEHCFREVELKEENEKLSHELELLKK